MRMWMVDPKIMCKNHLLGEHLELHMLVGVFRKKQRIDGFLGSNALEPKSVVSRHKELVNELSIRWRKVHITPLNSVDISYLTVEQANWKIDRGKALELLISRCPECRRRYNGGI